MPSVALNGDLTIVDTPPTGTPDATAGGFSAQDLRSMVQDFSNAPGPSSFGSFKPSVVSGLTVQTTAGSIQVRSPIDNSLYRAQQIGTAAQLTLVAPSTHQRVDRLVVRVFDQSIDSSGNYQATLETVTGGEDTTATLDNLASAATGASFGLTGATAICHVADLLVTTGGTVTLRDRRPMGQFGMIPIGVSIGTTMPTRNAHFIPAAGLDAGVHSQNNSTANFASSQSACLMYLPFRGPFTNVKWTLAGVSGGPGTFNLNIGIYDSNGFLLASTGSFAVAGTGGYIADITQALTGLPYSGYIFEPSHYYVAAGIGGSLSSLAYDAPCVAVGSPLNATIYRPPSVGMMFASPSGGTTLPTFLQASGTTFIDLAHTSPGGSFFINTPVVTLTT